MSRGPREYLALGVRHAAPAAEPGLYIVSTPIGHLGDITLRALEILAGVDLILAEDTRHSRRLLDHYGIATPMSAYHEHNAERARPEALARLAEGQALALISDAGTPLISDPGYKLALEASRSGAKVHPIPGASALLAALVAAGLPTDRFFFEGFLPPKAEARRARLNALAGVEATLVFYEAPQRLAACLADLAAELGDRPAGVARELTKLHETVDRAPLDELAARYADEETRGRNRHRRRAAAGPRRRRPGGIARGAAAPCSPRTRPRTPRTCSRRGTACRGATSMRWRWSWRGASRHDHLAGRRSAGRARLRRAGGDPRRRAAGGAGLPHPRPQVHDPRGRDRHRRRARRHRRLRRGEGAAEP